MPLQSPDSKTTCSRRLRLRKTMRNPLWLLAAICAVMFAGNSRLCMAQTATPATTASATTVPAEAVGDASGTTTGKASDLANANGALNDKAKKSLEVAGKHSYYGPGMQFLADAEGQNRVAINTVWLLVCGFLVMFMQAGFALVETGFTRAKNAVHTMTMNLCIYFIGLIGFWAVGFALMYGAASANGANLGGLSTLNANNVVAIPGLGSLFATNGFFLSGNNYDVGVCAVFLFQAVFMDTTATIPTGAMAERWKFSAFIVFGFFVSMILYPIFGHWAWGGGWLSQLGDTMGWGVGYVDFAGSGVVHTVGGMCAVAGVLVLGPRLGKYNRDGTANAIPGHNIPLALLGVLILGFGWFGFNAGSTLGASGAGNLRIGIVAVTTMMASAGGGFAAMIYMYARSGKPDPTMIANGFLGGLVAITASCAFVSPSVGVLIGAVGGLIVCWAVAFLDLVRIDDPVGAIAVHAGAGIWGVLAVGIFADGTYGNGFNGTMLADGSAKPLIGLLYGGTGQFIAQLVGALVAIAWGLGVSYAFFKIQDKVMGIRSTREDEIGGLDIPEMGSVAYPPEFLDPALQEELEEDYAPEPVPAAVY